MEPILTGHKLCKNCQKLFWPIKSDQKYCFKCRDTIKYYKPKPLIKKKCAQCDKEFKTSRAAQRFHSTECRYAFHSKKVVKYKKCLYCNKQFATTNNTRQYCKLEHYIMAKHKRDKEYYDFKLI